MNRFRLSAIFCRGRTVGSALLILVLLLVVLGLIVRSGTQPAQAQQGPGVAVVKDTLGQHQVIVAISATQMSNLGGFEFDVDVDPTVGRFESAQVGPFLDTSGRTVGTLGPLIGTQGETLGFGAYSYDPTGANAPGPTGNGILARLTLAVVGEGISPLDLRNPIFADVAANVQPVTAVDAALQARSLHPGWNLIAPCVDPSGLAVPDALASVDGQYDRAMGEEGSYVVGLSDPFQTLHALQPGRGYYLRITAGTTVTFTQVLPPYDPLTPIALGSGWHWIGYCPEASLPVTVALQSIEGLYDRVIGEEGTYVVGLPDIFQTLQELRQGRGYLVHMTGEGVLQFPAAAPRVAAQAAGADSLVSAAGCGGVEHTPYMSLAYGEVRVDGHLAPEGTVVEAVTPRGEVAGCFVVHTAGYFGVVQVYGEDPEGGIPGFREGEPVNWRVNGQPVTEVTSFAWADDKEVHRLTLSLGAGQPAGTASVFLPLVANRHEALRAGAGVRPAEPSRSVFVPFVVK